MPPLSLYIHLPWCVKKCPYCDFNSHEIKNIPDEEYIDCLIRDLEDALPLVWGRMVKSIFIGGGTPSLFSASAINRLLEAIRSRLQVSPYAEITLEANPGAIDNENIQAYSEAGVNRLSIGVQSFNDNHLKTLGRVHDSHLAFEAILLAKKYFKVVNIDLMYGLPNQTMDELANDISTALTFDLLHLSYYNLTLEPNTLFYKNQPSGLPDNDLCYEMQELIIKELQKKQIMRYETSAYASVGAQCMHNLNYWIFGDYLGIGAGAHSKLTFHDKIIRQVRQKHPSNYMREVFLAKHIIVNNPVLDDDLVVEFMMNALRLTDGFDSKLFTERTGIGFGVILPQLQKAVDDQLIQPLVTNMVVPTKKGQDFLNNLLEIFF